MHTLITWSPDLLSGDILFPHQRGRETALTTAVAVSLFTHRTAYDDDPLPDYGSDRRGWWGDHDGQELFGATPIGSRLWLLSREKQTEETRLRAEEYIREALQWMLDDRLCAAIDVAVAWFAHERLGATITIWRGPADSVAFRFATLWSAP